MTRQIYTAQQLQELKLNEIKKIARQLDVTPEADKRNKDNWVNAIINHQASQIEKIETRTEDDITFIDIDGFYNFEAWVNNKVIAEISHDAFDSEKCWYVTVSGIETYRSLLYSESSDWVKEQYVSGKLSQHQPQPVQTLTTREEKSATIEVLEQHGDEFVVHNCENNHYYIIRPNHLDPHQRCDCADTYYRGVKCKHQIAVHNYLVQQKLEKIIANTPNPEELLDKPFDELTPEKWEQLKEYKPTQSMELLTA